MTTRSLVTAGATRAPVQPCALPVEIMWTSGGTAQVRVEDASPAVPGVRPWGRRGDVDRGTDQQRYRVVHDPQPLLLLLEDLSLKTEKEGRG